MNKATRPHAFAPSAMLFSLRLGAGLLIIGAIALTGVIVVDTTSTFPTRPVERGGSDPLPATDHTKTLTAIVFPVRCYAPVEGDPKKVHIEYGSCAAVGKGTFLTAKHVVNTGNKSARIVVLVNDRELAATISPTTADFDAAVLSVPDYDGAIVRLADDLPKEGDVVFTAGFPVKYSGTALPRLIVTRGHVADASFPSPIKALHKPDVIRVLGTTDLGGSGGVVINRAGELLGVVIASKFVQNETTEVFAIPVKDLTPLLNEKH